MKLPPRIRFHLGSFVLLVGLMLPLSARAFSVNVHRFVTERALRGKMPIGNMSGLPEDSLVNFWVWFGETMSVDEGKADDLDGWRFRKHFPVPKAFTATSIRAYLALNYDINRRIAGMDTIAGLDGTERFNAHIQGSTWPDLDGRNQDRILRNPRGEPLHLKTGQLVPFDPMTLNMGELTGLSSQAHAHYQLVADKPSADPEVLKKEPWNFVVAFGFPGPVITYAAWMAQMHLDVATLAAFWGHVKMTSASEPIQTAWLAAGLHYVEDAAGPLHTVQVGSYEIFKRAQIAYWLEAVKTCGGYCGPLPSLPKIGMGYMHNHHLMVEAWLEEQVYQAIAKGPVHPEIAKAWAEMDVPDPELMAALGDRLKPYQDSPLKPAPWQDGRGLANLLVETEAKLASRDGGALYEAALLAGAPTLTALDTFLPDDSGWRKEYLGDINDPQVKAAVDTMARIQAKSLRRAATAVRIYYDALETASVDAAGRRLRRACLDNLEAAEKRREIYAANPPPEAIHIIQDQKFLAIDAGGFVAFLTLLWLLLRRLGRKKAA
jgi:hypothetical protein